MKHYHWFPPPITRVVQDTFPTTMLYIATLAASALLVPLPRQAPASMVRSTPIAMASGNDGVDFPDLDGSEIRIGIIKARWHPDICDSLAEGAKASLKKCGVKDENIIESEVPGSFELPLAARYMALSGSVDAVLPIGLLIKVTRENED